MNMKDIAKLCNVSVSTVSKAFWDADDISDDTKQMIFSIARENGCYEKYYKGKYHKFVVAVICPELNSEYYARFVEMLQPSIENVGGLMVVASDGFDDVRQQELVEYFASGNRADGIIVFSLKTLKKGYDVPIISIGKSDPAVDSVLIDQSTGICAAVKHLKALGHRKIAFLGEKLTVLRQKIFEDAIKANGLFVDEKNTVVTDCRFENSGFFGMKKLLESKTDCTAVFCSYDHIAIGAIRRLVKEGYKVPEDFSVVGMDNITPSEYLERSLTTVDSHIEDTCTVVADLMAKKVKNRWVTAKQRIEISSDLVVRETTAKARE